MASAMKAGNNIQSKMMMMKAEEEAAKIPSKSGA